MRRPAQADSQISELYLSAMPAHTTTQPMSRDRLTNRPLQRRRDPRITPRFVRISYIGKHPMLHCALSTGLGKPELGSVDFSISGSGPSTSWMIATSQEGGKRLIKLFRCRRKYSKAGIHVRSDLSTAGQLRRPAIDQREPWVLAPDFWNSVSAAEGALYLGSCRHARAFSNRAVCRACRVSGPNALQIPGA